MVTTDDQLLQRCAKKNGLITGCYFTCDICLATMTKAHPAEAKITLPQTCYRDQPISCSVDAGGCLYGGKHPI